LPSKKKRQNIQDEKTAATARIEELMAELVAVENRRQDIQNEKMAATARVEELTAELVAVEKKRQDNQKAVAELQRRRRDAEQGFAVLQEDEAAAPSTPEITSSTLEIKKPSVSNGLALLLGFAVGAAAVFWLTD
jgi:chromosome segregation ATPase